MLEQELKSDCTTKIIGNCRHESVAIISEKWVNFKRDFLELSFLRKPRGFVGSCDRRRYNPNQRLVCNIC